MGYTGSKLKVKATGKGGRRVAVCSGVAVVVLLASLACDNHERIRRWYVLWTAFERLEENPQGYREYKHRQTGIVFISLPGGKVEMGSSKEESESAAEEAVRENPERTKTSESERLALERPRHKVTLSPFLIAKYEVSQAQWERLTGDNPSPDFRGNLDLPVHKVSWEDCWEFCRKSGLSFPTEAQWEYACRGGTNTAFAFGGGITVQQANFRAFTQAPLIANHLLPVESLSPNPFGLYNVHGNVEEWCQDVFDERFYSSLDSGEPDPVASSSYFRGFVLRGFRIKRGGSRLTPSWECRSGSRAIAPTRERADSVGFRPVF